MEFFWIFLNLFYSTLLHLHSRISSYSSSGPFSGPSFILPFNRYLVLPLIQLFFSSSVFFFFGPPLIHSHVRPLGPWALLWLLSCFHSVSPLIRLSGPYSGPCSSLSSVQSGLDFIPYVHFILRSKMSGLFIVL